MAALPLPHVQPTPEPHDIQQRYYSIVDAARIAGLHPQSLYRMIRRGQIPAYGHSNNYRVKLSDVLPPVDVTKPRNGPQYTTGKPTASPESHAEPPVTPTTQE